MTAEVAYVHFLRHTVSYLEVFYVWLYSIAYLKSFSDKEHFKIVSILFSDKEHVLFATAMNAGSTSLSLSIRQRYLYLQL